MIHSASFTVPRAAILFDLKGQDGWKAKYHICKQLLLLAVTVDQLRGLIWNMFLIHQADQSRPVGITIFTHRLSVRKSVRPHFSMQ